MHREQHEFHQKASDWEQGCRMRFCSCRIADFGRFRKAFCVFRRFPQNRQHQPPAKAHPIRVQYPLRQCRNIAASFTNWWKVSPDEVTTDIKTSRSTASNASSAAVFSCAGSCVGSCVCCCGAFVTLKSISPNLQAAAKSMIKASRAAESFFNVWWRFFNAFNLNLWTIFHVSSVAVLLHISVHVWEAQTSLHSIVRFWRNFAEHVPIMPFRKGVIPHIFSVSTLYQQIIEYSRRAAISIIKNRILLIKPMFAYHVYSCEQSEYYPW